MLHCVCIISWPIFFLWTHTQSRAWSSVCFNSVCPCYFRATLSCENTAAKKHAKHKRAPGHTCLSSLCLFTWTRMHLCSVSTHEKSLKKHVETLRERNFYLRLVSASHLGAWLSTGSMESLMKPLQSLGRWRPLIAIIAVMKLTIRSCLRVRARCHRNQEQLGDTHSRWKFWEKVLNLEFLLLILRLTKVLVEQ